MNFIKGELFKEGKLKFHSGDMQITLPDEIAAKLEKHASGKIILGVRPENIYDVKTVRERKVSEAHNITIEVVEPIGNEIFLYFNFDNQNLCMRTAPEQIYHPNEDIKIGFDLIKMYFFDPKTEERIA